LAAKRTPAGEPSTPPKEPTQLRRTFAQNLRERREAVGMSQRGLAKAAQVSLRQIWEIESNARNVTLDTVTLLAEQLGCPEIDLLSQKPR
jgi:transcriptional regulator with XRE-family HTH domain